ncbi:hypothetical protein [Serratia sp. 14-2641]|uniref:hypothetical protein n=1 Tax=Serratia sp. 14-2641 TaxID=1841657 RepID=UPI00080FCE1C|nr:hypothetical protein [Serratia sp. 14-2641]OCJ44091.1 hypothetical protein A6U95_19220 [Serratia sp. 14-2641]
MIKVPVQKTKAVEIKIEIAQEAYKEYAAQFGKGQSLERLCERGGFSWYELASLLYDRIKRLEGVPKV